MKIHAIAPFRAKCFLIVFVLFFALSVIPFTVQAQTITSSISWSAISPAPTSSSDIIIENGAVVTVDVSNAAAASITLGENGLGTGTLVFNSGSQLTVSGIVTVGINATDNGTLTMTSGGTLICSTIAPTSGASTLNLSTISTGGTIEYTGNVTAPTFTTYRNLTISGNVSDLPTGVIINGNLIIAGTLTPAYGATITLRGNFTNNGTFTHNGSTIIFNRGTQTLNGSSSSEFNNLTISGLGTTLNVNQNTEVSGTLRVNYRATLTPLHYCTISGRTLTGNGTVRVTYSGNNNDLFSQYDFFTRTLNNLIVYMAGTVQGISTAVTMRGLTIALGSTTNVTQNLTVRRLIVDGKLNPSSSVVISGDTLEASGTLKVTRATNSNDFTGQYSFTRKTLTYVTIEMAGSSPQKISTALSCYKLVLTNSASVNVNADITASLDLDYGSVINPASSVVLSGSSINGTGTLKVTRANNSNDFTGQYNYSNLMYFDRITVDMAGTDSQEVSESIPCGIFIVSNTSGPVSINADIPLLRYSIYGTFTVNAGATVIPSASSVITGSELTGNGTIKVTRANDSADLTTQYNFGTQTLTDLSIEMAGSADQKLGAAVTCKNFTVNTAGTLTVEDGYDITVDNASGIFTVNSGATVSPESAVVISGKTMTGSGTASVTRSTGSGDFTGQYAFTAYTLSALTTAFSGASTQGSSLASYNKLLINNSSGVTLETPTTISTSCTLQNGTLDNSSNTLTLGPDASLLIVDGALSTSPSVSTSSDIMITSDGNISLGNSLPSGTDDIDNMTINTTSNGDVTLDHDATINGTLTLTSGHLILGSNLVTLDDGAAFAGGSSTSYIRINGTGRVKAPVSSSNINFPIGYNPYLPVIINSPNGDADFTVGVSDGITDQNGVTLVGDVVNKTWDISSSATVTGVVLTIQWNTAEELAGFGNALSHIAYRTSPTDPWNGLQAFGPAQNPSPGVFTQMIVLDMLAGQTYLFGISDPGAPALPVEFINFTAKEIGNKTALLEWSTAQEINNDRFEIERSTDANKWTKIGTVNGSGNSSVIRNYSFHSPMPESTSPTLYFRLKQVDYNGAHEYSVIRTIQTVEASAIIRIYPNPANDFIRVEMGQLKTSIRILDYRGITVLTQEGEENITLTVSWLKKGIYFMQIISPEGTRTASFQKL